MLYEVNRVFYHHPDGCFIREQQWIPTRGYHLVFNEAFWLVEKVEDTHVYLLKVES
jgi:hypothetical protein